MATWSFEEDFIVCEFFFEHLDGGWKPYIEKLMERLKARGFGQRDKGSAIMRLQNYEYLHTGTKGLSRAAAQSRRMYDAFSKMIKNATITANYNKRNNSASTVGTTTVLASSFAQNQSLPPLSLSYLSSNAANIYNSMFGEGVETSFQEVLFKFIDDRGLTDPEVYKACFVRRDTFSAIRCGKNNGVSKRTVMQLCFGLKLNIDEAVVLMASAGYAFADKLFPDKIVVKYLKDNNPDIFAANIELYDNGADLLF